MTPLGFLERFWRDEAGTTLVELAIVIAMLLAIVFGMLDLGRLAHNWVMAEKAMQTAARMAAVRPPACSGVPDRNLPASGNTARFGTACSSGAAACQGEGTAPVQCTGAAANSTVSAIWNQIAPLVSGRDTVTGQEAGPTNLRFVYAYDPDMNFLGGPYVPVVTVEIQNLQFESASPLLGLARLAGIAPDSTGSTFDPFSFPPMSVSLPGEDLALGEAG